MAPRGSQAQRREVHYAGRVQGVGFRYTVRRLAADAAVSGFVKNLPDGRVQLVVEGDARAIDELLSAVAEAMGDYIRDASTDARPATGEFESFEIRY